MSGGIDWDAIESARLALAPRNEIPPGWFTTRMYAEKFGRSVKGASTILRRLVAAGSVEKRKHCRGLIYRPKP